MRVKNIVLSFLVNLFLLPVISWGQTPTNGGFETGTTSSWTTTGSITTTNARTGTYALVSASSTSTTNTAHINSTIISVANNEYAHVIGWAIGSSSYSNASVGGTMGGSTYSTETQNIGTTLTRLTNNRLNATGAAADFTCRVNSRSSTSGNATQVYFDDIIMYTDAISTADLLNPTAPSGVATNSDQTGTTITLTWTDGTDAETGSQKALILRANGTGQTSPTLNNQAQYVAGDAIGLWTIKGIVDVGTQTYADNTTSANTAYTYVVYMRDLAFNYSAGTSSSITALPVELTSFASTIHGNQVTLNWSTATEVNNYGFEVQRASTKLGTSWEKIGFVQGHGNSNSPKNYSFTDKPTGGKEFQYRLNQIDFNGAFEYSEITTAILENVSEFKLEQNYPNPFNPMTRISYTLPVRTSVKLRVYDLLAQVVAELVNGIQEAGRYDVTFDGSNFPSGAYFYKLEAGSYIEVKKLLLVK